MIPAIRASNLGKRYRIGELRYGSLRESITDTIGSPLRRLSSRAGGNLTGKQYVWAVRNVDFEVKEGEIVGLVGSNGAGKSTVLKILSRITRPTTGQAEIYGRVRSLLEVGTGFHPELTGRENVFLNGAILGMRRNEIRRKFDEIVSFAEIEEFLDTPVKHYSSGMYVRLAFAVAAFLEPEILLVDEVLAVGDARFWQKSIDKMRELNARGMTIVLVTHNMWLIQTVCTRGILLRKGCIAAQGHPHQVIEAYRSLSEGELATEPAVAVRDTPDEPAEINGLEFTPLGNWLSEREARPESGMELRFTAYVRGSRPVRAYIRITTPDGFVLFTVYSDPVEVSTSHQLTFRATIARLMLRAGDYAIWVGLCSDREREEMLVQAHLPLLIRDSGGAHPEAGVFWNRAEWFVRQVV